MALRTLWALMALTAPGWLVGPALAESRLVRTQAEYAAAIDQVEPGDVITLANGEWRDFQILFTGEGQAGRPITLTAETPGGVILAGRSNLRLAGEHLVVSSLIFRDGWSPTGEVIAFRQNRGRRANNSRVTNVVIDGFSKPVRRESDNWIALYGYGNRFDHNHITGKTNAGATLVVVRDAEQGLENRHSIDHNYFGYRPNLGSNGGETIRIGTSHDSASDSFTTVAFNWFEHCDGEVEIVSSKSGSNLYLGNVFMESRGALVLRHGDNNRVEDNVFFGRGVANTGGIRVINRRNTIINNYMEGLTGEGFASALTIMYGVPNSPLNRYVPVEQAVIENNTIVDARQVFLGAGMDSERSAAPVASRMSANLIVNRDGRDPVRVLGDMSGLSFSANIRASAAVPVEGFASQAVEWVRATTGLLVPVGLEGVGARRDLTFIPRSAVGVAWYSKDRDAIGLDGGKVVAVEPGEDSLTRALAAAGPGDRLTLAPGVYGVNEVLVVDRPITVEGPIAGVARVLFSRPSLFEIDGGGSLRLSRLEVSGLASPDAAGNSVIRTRHGIAGYQLIIENSRFEDLNVNRSFNVFTAGPASLADRIVLNAVTAERISGSVIAANAEREDLGTYNAEVVEITGSTFRDVSGPSIDLYRGGRDESTFGPRLLLAGSTFDLVGREGEAPGSVKLHGVQRAEFVDNRFSDSGPVRFFRQVGEPVLVWRQNRPDRNTLLISNHASVETSQ